MDCLKSAGICLASIHQLLKKQRKSMCLLNCARVKDHLHDSENWPRSPFDRSNFVPLPSTLSILGFHSNYMEDGCRIVLKSCVNVIGRNARVLAWLRKWTKVIVKCSYQRPNITIKTLGITLEKKKNFTGITDIYKMKSNVELILSRILGSNKNPIGGRRGKLLPRAMLQQG